MRDPMFIAEDEAKNNPGQLIRYKRGFYLYHIGFIWRISWNYCPLKDRQYLHWNHQQNWIVNMEIFTSYSDPSFKTIKEAYRAIMAKDHIY
jgi:hypothetical protein